MPSQPVAPANAVPYDVRLKAKKRSSGGYKIWMPGPLDFPLSRLKFNKKDLGMKHDQVHWVQIHLQNLSGATLRFHPDCSQVFWIKPGDKSEDCPDCPSTVAGIEAKWSDECLLIVQNDNKTVEDYRFTINLLEDGDDGSDPSTYIPFDPGWSNRNSGVSLNRALTPEQAVGVAVLGAAAVAGILWLFSKGRGSGRR